MAYLITCVNGVVLSNGESVNNIKTGHLCMLKGVKCVIGFRLELLNPTRCLDKQLLVETPYLGDETDLLQLIQSIITALENDVPFTRLVGVRHSVERYLKDIKQRFKMELKTMAFTLNVKALEEEYKHLPPELIKMVKNFDHFYDYSDDINVYRGGVEREKVMKNELTKAGGLDFLYKYRALL